MLASVTRQYAKFLLSFGHLSLLFVGAHVGSYQVWAILLGLVSLISLCFWISINRRFRAIGDTPTSRIASAAQGYVELLGPATQYTSRPLKSPVTFISCVWYSYTVEARDGKGHWTQQYSAESDDVFLLADSSGECVVDPEQAEIITTHKRRWRVGNERYTEYHLLPNDMLYAIGEFATLGGEATELNLNRDVSDLLAEWKKDKTTLHRRFDLDQNGGLDLREWALARQAAKREMSKQHAEIRSQPGTHVLRKPKDGRLHLISNLDPDKLSRQYSFWAWAHLVIFFLAGIGALLMISNPTYLMF